MQNREEKRGFYAVSSSEGGGVEIDMYGDVCEEWPTDWWTGERLEGSYITLDGFLKDLDRLEKAESVTIRLNSYGGDCAAALVIHNRLRELSRGGTKTVCIVDGVAMSAGSIIMAACDTVRANPSSLIMIHKCWAMMCGGYNADDLKDQLERMSAYDNAVASTYARKTGLGMVQIMHMMGETVYLTGKEAVEKGFADELIEDAEPLQLVASADGYSIYCRGREIHLAPGMCAPNSIPTVKTKNAAAGEDPGGAQNRKEKEGEYAMSKDELMAQNPELVAEIEAKAADAAIEKCREEAEAKAASERERIRAIDDIASLFPQELVVEAKYGDSRCTAEQLSYRAALAAKEKGRSYLSAVERDTQDSNTQKVTAAPAPEPKAQADKTAEERQAEADAVFRKLLGK